MHAGFFELRLLFFALLKDRQYRANDVCQISNFVLKGPNVVFTCRSQVRSALRAPSDSPLLVRSIQVTVCSNLSFAI